MSLEQLNKHVFEVNILFADNLTPCWLLSLLCGLFLLLITLLALSAATRNNVLYEHEHQLSRRCIGSRLYDYKKINNETVHLVHDSDAWTKKQFAVVEGVLQNYEPRKVHLVVFGLNKSFEITTTTATESTINTTAAVKKRSLKKAVVKKVKIKKEPRRKRRSLPKAKSPQKTIYDVLRAYPDVVLETLNYTEAFKNSPLYNTWQNLNEKTRLFAVRAIYLWQYGGISFDLLDENYENLSRYKYTANNKTSVENVIVLGLTAFKTLPKGIVTIDDKGWHMESRTSCHAFFGDMLMNLRKSHRDVTPEDIIKKTLDVFCRKGAIDSGYCSTVKR